MAMQRKRFKQHTSCSVSAVAGFISITMVIVVIDTVIEMVVLPYF